MQFKKLQTMKSRTGRHMQRYNEGSRLVVGCIPFRIRKLEESTLVHGSLIDDLVEVLLISSQKSPRMMFPKGGWETDETIEEAALRECFEEAGVWGDVWENLGVWSFKSKSQDTFHEGYMLPLLVEEELDVWPEKDVRKRQWMSLAEARALCWHQWMKDALDVFICQLNSRRTSPEELPTTCLLEYLSKEAKTGIVAQTGDEEVVLC